jgi:hypothetical protein
MQPPHALEELPTGGAGQPLTGEDEGDLLAALRQPRELVDGVLG